MPKTNATRKLDAVLANNDADILDTHLTVGSRDARVRFGKIVEKTKNGDNQFVITEHGEPAAAVVPISDLRILDWIKRQNIKDKITDAVFKHLTFDEFKKLFAGEEEDEERKNLEQRKKDTR
jgi:prevent-host-death family protein